MSTFRIARRRKFTTIAQETVNDERLSFRARGILLWLLDIALSEAKRSTRVSEDPAGTYGEGRTERCHAVRDSRRSFASAHRLIPGRLPIGDRRA